MNLRLLPAAEDEIISAALWYDDRRLGLGDEFVAELQAELNLVKTHAASLPTVEGYAGRHDIRRHLMKRFPYAIVVARFEDDFVVIAIAHTRRRPCYWLDRLN